MNKTAITLGYFILVGLGIAGAVIILIVRPDSLGVLVNTLVTVLGLATVAAGTFSALGHQDRKLETIKAQTNGTLSKLTEENRALHEAITALALQVPPPVVQK